MQPFLLDPQDNDDVGPLEGVFNSRRAAHLLAEAFKFPREPHGRAAKGETAAEFAEQVKIGARDAAVKDVADDRDVEILHAAVPIADGEGIQESLGGML